MIRLNSNRHKLDGTLAPFHESLSPFLAKAKAKEPITWRTTHGRILHLRTRRCSPMVSGINKSVQSRLPTKKRKKPEGASEDYLGFTKKEVW